MSRIGKQPINIPSGVEVTINKQEVKVKGPKGELLIKVCPEVEVAIKENQVITSVKEETGKTKALWGLSRSLINNAVLGVTKGFKKELEIQGVGYRARVEGDELVLELGFSHPVNIKRPEGIEFEVQKNIIVVSGIDKQLVGEITANIRSQRPPEPYKGKGIRYLGESVIRKVGKRAADAAA